MTHGIPAGYHTITPTIMYKNTQKAIEFYAKAFDAELLDAFHNPNGNGIMHASIKIGNSILMLGDEMPGNSNCSQSAETLGASPISLYIYVADADKVFEQAVSAGAQVTMPLSDTFWGDRAGQVRDPFGYAWMIATHIKDLSQEEIKKNAEEFFASMQN
ncbi:VOC family protein [Legionella sp. 27cVA30]|uniref:VOC family protein n=1 Tax=Legionella sp. 27cVA30 TaxID=2905657 RepID=UPI00209ECD3D|nr:VOC family protein [Legionella sp. 27cVA30]MCP0913654.1 VOC family protein [Legionella sp. 27cVA30]